MIINNNNIALDTNVLIYIIDNSNSNKHEIAKELLLSNPMISSQVVSEFINVTKRLLQKPKLEVLGKCIEWLHYGKIKFVSLDTMELAKELINKYDFQIFDSLIVASALETNCKILYTEDMQHGLIVEKKLTIINPFLT